MVAKSSQFILLIVEDESDIRDILKDSLEDVCDKIFTAENGRMAVDAIMKGLRPDAILSDINMPILNGIELLGEMNHLGLNIPFIFLSGYGNEEAVKDCEKLGGFSFLEKPFELQGLRDTVQKALEVGSKIKELELKILSTPLQNRKTPKIKAYQDELDKLLKLKFTPKTSKKAS